MNQQTASRPASKAVQIVKDGPLNQADRGVNATTATVVVGVVSGLVIAAIAAVLLRRKSARMPARAAFEDLASLLRLSRSEQETVRQMAAAGGIIEPVALLVSADKMREAAQAYLRIAAGSDISTRTQRLLTKVHGN
jgi:hypothetical protein